MEWYFYESSGNPYVYAFTVEKKSKKETSTYFYVGNRFKNLISRAR